LFNNDHKITVQEWRILFYLWNQDIINQQELASIAKKEKSTITRQLDSLEKKGLLCRRNSEQDKRNKLLVLSPERKEIKKHAMKISEQITNYMENDIERADLLVFKKVLIQMIRNLDQTFT
jgi:DNA-binding MarR family transcriptional regulator